MRLFAGVVIGIVIGRPVLDVVNEKITPPVRRAIADGALALYTRVGDWLVRKVEENP